MFGKVRVIPCHKHMDTTIGQIPTITLTKIRDVQVFSGNAQHSGKSIRVNVDNSTFSCQYNVCVKTERAKEI